MPQKTIQQLQNIIQEKIEELQHMYALSDQQKLIIKQLEEKQFYFEDILAHVPSHVYWLNRDNIYLGCNDAHAKTVGLSSRHQIVGKSNYDMPWHAQAESINSLNQLVMTSGIAQSREETVTIDNIIHTYISEKVPLRNKENEIIGLLGISIDITERKKVDEALRQAKELAEAASQAKSEFLANMRHDIRTPLSGIVGFSEILKLESREPRIKEYADNLMASSHALLHLMDEVLEAVRVSSGEIPMLKKKFELKQSFQKIIDLYAAKALEKKLSLTLTMDSKLPNFVIGDKIRLHRIALELIGNALNFTDTGSVNVQVILAKQENRQLVIKMIITDTGIGIPKDKQQDIYLQFKRLTPSYQGIYKGAGLGLFVVKQFLDELGGEIYVTSEAQQGTTFTCLIPLQEPLLDDDYGTDPVEDLKIEQSYLTPICQHPAPETVETEPNTNKSYILVVEDNGIAQIAAKTLLSALSCKVDIAMNGKDALNLCEKNQYDLIMMDIGLGAGMDGYEVTHHLRNKPETKHIPIIALTAHAGDDNKQRCIAAGMNAVLTKPLTHTHAVDIIATFIPTRRAPVPVANSSRPDLPDDDAELFQLGQFSLLDIDQALQNCGNEAMVIELLSMLLTQEMPNDLAAMKQAFASNDYAKVEKIAHKIKGGAVYVGTTRMKYACQYVERYWKTGERELFGALYEQAITVIDETCLYIKSWLDNKT